MNRSQLDALGRKLDNANSFLDSSELYLIGIVFGVFASLIANILHDYLKQFGVLYILLVVCGLVFSLERFRAFRASKAKSMYRDDEYYKYMEDTKQL